MEAIANSAIWVLCAVLSFSGAYLLTEVVKPKVENYYQRYRKNNN